MIKNVNYSCIQNLLVDFSVKSKYVRKIIEKMNEAEKEKTQILHRISPVGIVPMATGTAFLLGSKGENTCPGHPSLPIFLLLAGTIVIGLGVMTSVSRFIVYYGISSGKNGYTIQQTRVMWLLEHLGYIMVFSQVILLIAGTIIVLPLATTVHPWDYEDVNAKYYCDYGTVLFSAIFFPLVWILLFLTFIAYICIQCYVPSTEQQNNSNN
jgi:hypothetical protein